MEELKLNNVSQLPRSQGCEVFPRQLNKLRVKYDKDEKELKDKYRKYTQQIFESNKK